jgi:hypothetical protein
VAVDGVAELGQGVWLGFLFPLAAVAGGMADERAAVVAVGAVEAIRVLDVAGRRVDERERENAGRWSLAGLIWPEAS